MARKIDSRSAEGKRLLGEVQALERRRSQRVVLEIPVQLHLSMPNDRVLQLAGFTQVVNAHGCLLATETKMEVGQRATLLNLKSGTKQSSTVLSAQKSRESGFAVTMEFDRPAPEIWSPPLSSEDKETKRF